MIVSFSVISIVSSRISNFLVVKNTLFANIFLSFISSIMILFASDHYILTIGMCIFSSGCAISYPVIFSRSMEIFREIRGTASSAIVALRYLAFFAITGVASYFYNGASSSLAIVLIASSLLVLWINVHLLENCELFKEKLT